EGAVRAEPIVADGCRRAPARELEVDVASQIDHAAVADDVGVGLAALVAEQEARKASGPGTDIDRASYRVGHRAAVAELARRANSRCAGVAAHVPYAAGLVVDLIDAGSHEYPTVHQPCIVDDDRLRIGRKVSAVERRRHRPAGHRAGAGQIADD